MRLEKFGIIIIIETFFIISSAYSVETKFNNKNILQNNKLNVSSNNSLQTSTPKKSFSMVTSFAKYLQYQNYEGVEAEQLLGLTLTPEYQSEKFKYMAIIDYTHNEKNPNESDLDDIIWFISPSSKNFVPALKWKYFFVGNLGTSKPSREDKRQYGSLGLGLGLGLDTSYFKIPQFTLTTSLSLSKSFQESEVSKSGKSNVNVYSISKTVMKYEFKKVFLYSEFLFLNSQKYDHEFSNYYLTFQEVVSKLSKDLELAIGHSNKALTLDQETGDMNVRILNNETSYFYVRLDWSI